MRNLETIVKDLRRIRDEYDEYGYGDIHDQIHYQLEGIFDDYDEAEQDEALIRNLNVLVEQLEAHLYYITNLPEFNWIYG
jgi:dissimilatory sulfite reductase (desulfoviridin) alpha/beta subunit